MSPSMSESFTFPDIAQAAIRSLAVSGGDEFDKNKDFYRNAVAMILGAFAEIMDEMEGMGRLEEHPELTENEPYSLWILLNEMRQKGIEIDEESESVMDYFFAEP
jgi:hypothetical protein